MQKTILSPNSLEAGLYKISFHIGLLDTKICRKVAQAVLPNWLPNIKYMGRAFFGDRFVGKKDGLRTYKSSSQEWRGGGGDKFTAYVTAISAKYG